MSEKFRNKYRSESARLKNWDYGTNASYFITICTKNRDHFFGEINPTNHKMELTEIGKLAEKFWFEIPVHFPFVKLGEFVVMPNHTHGILIIHKNELVGNENDRLDETEMDGNDDGQLDETEMVGTRLIASLPFPFHPIAYKPFPFHPIAYKPFPFHPIAHKPFVPQSITHNPFTSQPFPFQQIVKNQILSPKITQQPNSDSIQKKTGGITGHHNPMIQENISRIVRWYKGRCTFEMRKINPNFAWQPRFHDHIIRDGFAFERIEKYIANNPMNWKEDKFQTQERNKLSSGK